MTCHECDSEVAENDVFCPFCGISLQSAAKAEIPVDDSMESTIMIQHADLSAFKSDSTVSEDLPAQTIEPVLEDTRDAAPEDVSEVFPVAEPVEAEPAMLVLDDHVPVIEDESGIDDLPPTPQILNDTNITSGNLTPDTTSDYIFESPVIKEPVMDIIEPEVPETVLEDASEQLPPVESELSETFSDEVVEPLLPAEPSVSESVPVFEIDDPSTAEQLHEDLADNEDDLFIPAVNLETGESAEPAVEEIITSSEGFIEEQADVVAEELIENVPAETVVEDVEPILSAPVEIEVVEEPVSEEISSEVIVKDIPADTPYTKKDTYAAPLNTDPFKERIEPLDKGISMPVDGLMLEDAFSSPSTFDSVRIMEQKEPAGIPVSALPLPGVPVVNEKSSADLSKPTSTSGIDSPRLSTGGDTDGKKGSKLKPLSEGVVLNNRYEIVRKIGGGGMGAVYLASDNNLGGVLRAVKEMVQTHIEEEQQEKAVSDFKRESVILSTLDHSSIPTIFDYFYDESESRFYLVMKYISGGDLSSRLRSAPEGKIEEKRVTEWAIQIIDVLDYLHNQPSTIVYRDLKPSNIMIDGNSGRIMLIDFGIARSINQKAEKGVTAVGTMGYAPPELFSGNVEPRSDIYSLGSTMFHLLTGADPQSNPLLIFDFQKNPRPRQINPQLSDQMERILMRAVEYNAEARFASAAEMRGVLEEHLANIISGKLTYGVTEAPVSVSLANQNVFCGFCGQRIVATDLFCAFCGAKQPIAQHGVHSEIYSQSAFTAKLVIEGTSELPAPTYSLVKEENLLGRRDPMSNIFPEVDLSRYDPQTKISRRHAKIWRDGNNYLVEDLGSSNGTILTRSASDSMRLVPNRPQALSNGDVIKVGDANLHFVVG